MSGEQSENEGACFGRGISIENRLELWSGVVDSANGNEIHNVRQVFTFFEALGVFHRVEFECDEVEWLRNR